jgi:hypothetical protein
VAMANVLNDEKKQQVLALGRLGWSLGATPSVRGTSGASPSNPANEVITDFGAGKSACEAILTGPGLPSPADAVIINSGLRTLS